MILLRCRPEVHHIHAVPSQLTSHSSGQPVYFRAVQDLDLDGQHLAGYRISLWFTFPSQEEPPRPYADSGGQRER